MKFVDDLSVLTGFRLVRRLAGFGFDAQFFLGFDPHS